MIAGRYWHAAAALVLALLCMAAIVLEIGGPAAIIDAAWSALPALPAALAIHAVQLSVAGLGWLCLLPSPRPGAFLVMRVRWVREALNTLLPFAGFGGGIASTRMLAQGAGMTIGAATASLTGDLTMEAAALGPFLLISLALAAWMAPGSMSAGRALLASLPVLGGAAGFVVAQRAGMMRWVERIAARLGFGQAMAGLHDALMALHARRADLARAWAIHFLAWGLGGAEVFVIMAALHHPVGPLTAFAMEGLGMAGRSLGFALPAGLAAQEAGFVVAGAIFGVPGPVAIALSMVKRVRELVVAIAGVVVWRALPVRENSLP